jgi:hypothetical protein
MSEPQPPADDLREHLSADTLGGPRRTGAPGGAGGHGPQGAASGEPCPSPEDWWKGWRGDLPDDAFGRLVDHAGGCAQCSLMSRVAREMVLRLEPRRYRGAPRTSPWLARGLFAAAAAALVAVVGLSVGPWRGGVQDSEVRTQAEEPLSSLVDESRPLPRSGGVLRWTPGPAGTRYQVEVTDEALRPLASGRGLGTPEFAVPADALTALPPGARVVWQVQAILPDGRRIASPTFFQALE